MGRILLPHPENRFSKQAFEIYDDFNYYIKGDQWTDIQTDGTATVAVADGQGSDIKILSSADNDSGILHTSYEGHQFIANTPLNASTRILFTDSTDNEAALCFGFADAFALDIIADGGNSLAINDSGAMIYKRSDAGATQEGTSWFFQTEVGGSSTVSQSTAVPQSTSYQDLEIDIVPRSATVFEARPKIDGVQLKDSTSGELIMHTITLGTSTAMQLGLELKGGHADDTDVLVDWIYASQGRA